MATLPEPLMMFDPIVEKTKDFLVHLHNMGIPWWGVLGVSCIFVRLSIMPLIFLQLSRASRLTALLPVVV